MFKKRERCFHVCSPVLVGAARLLAQEDGQVRLDLGTKGGLSGFALPGGDPLPLYKLRKFARNPPLQMGDFKLGWGGALPFCWQGAPA